ncbi:protein kinase [Actinomadura sp. SCN-SB]|uniref:serine/threonine-protein kinase n=1 Tax=Actinomadura sp. SCN-SB TaxID=3373092 RepID=UPI003753A610
MRRLGAGGMGVVYLAVAPDGGRVAVKVMHPAWVAEPGFPHRFEREVEAIRRVAPFCTAPVVDHAVTEDVAYIVTEYVEGRTLWDTVKEDGPLSGARLESVAVGTAVALNAIHRAGVVHRDLKPGNVILSPEGLRVIDFGIAKLAGAGPITGNVAMGTPPFMAPEQAAGDEVTPAADVFSWGAVVTFAGTGEPPFGQASPDVMFYRLMHEEPRLGGLPGRLRTLVAGALDKRPERRPGARELIDELAGRPLGESAKAVLRSGWSALGPVPPTERDRPLEEPEKPEERPSGGGPSEAPGTEPPPSTHGPEAPERRLAGRLTALRLGRGPLAALAAGAVAVAGFALYQAYGTEGTATTGTSFEESFDTEGDWPRAVTAAGTARYYKGGYLLQPLPGQGMAATAPVRADRMTSVRMSTTARMQVGSGEYGIWCAGTPVTDAQSRYSFSVTTDGRAGITKEGRDGARWTLVPFRAAPGAAAGSGENRIEAECRFTGDGTALRMLVNGREVAAFRDRRAAYGPGAVGVAAISRDTAGGATARYESFSVRRQPE